MHVLDISCVCIYISQEYTTTLGQKEELISKQILYSVAVNENIISSSQLLQKHTAEVFSHLSCELSSYIVREIKPVEKSVRKSCRLLR
jgi:hypothetical protein